MSFTQSDRNQLRAKALHDSGECEWDARCQYCAEELKPMEDEDDQQG